MAWKWYDIDNYKTSIGGTNYYGGVQLFGVDFYAFIKFHTDGSLPETSVPTTNGQRFYGHMDYHKMSAFIELLRNEEPLRFGWDEINPNTFQLEKKTETLPLIPFIVHSTDSSFVAPVIRLHYDIDVEIKPKWEEVLHYAQKPPGDFRSTLNREELIQKYSAVEYLRDAIERMTGRNLEIKDGNDFSTGINFILLRGAPPDIFNDPEIQYALREDGVNKIPAREAYYIRSEQGRVIIVARTFAGLMQGSASLAESKGYEVLGMGPNWMHVPNHKAGLIFSVRESGRPSFTLRYYEPTSGEVFLGGTISHRQREESLKRNQNLKLTDPSDEYVSDSYWRWSISQRVQPVAAHPAFPGNILQKHRSAILELMVEQNSRVGFLAPTFIGMESTRPDATSTNENYLWINTNEMGNLVPGLYRSNGVSWEKLKKETYPEVDITADLVRKFLLGDLISKAEVFWNNNPDELFIYGIEPNDGAKYKDMSLKVSDPMWYLHYRNTIGEPLTKPYKLYGSFYLYQEFEMFDPNLQSNHVFALADWLLREYDDYLNTLPMTEQVTSIGQLKSTLIRISFYSYNYHDVPPEFNPDSRMQLLVGDFPKHRGKGKWIGIRTKEQTISALRKLIPNASIGFYQIRSNARSRDININGILDTHDASPKGVIDFYGNLYNLGVRSINLETDFNFGKQGLAYYLTAKYLWNTSLSVEELNEFRRRFLRLAYGSVWEIMESYYDSLLLNQRPFNGVGVWREAIHLINKAQAKLDLNQDPDPFVQKRLDDLKQYWYFYYLLVTIPTGDYKNSPAMQTFAWKGQMSYMTAMHMVLNNIFETRIISEALPQSVHSGSAHYSKEETAVWWSDVVAHWPHVPIENFKDVRLNNGILGSAVDLNDMVQVAEFQSANDTLKKPNQQVLTYTVQYPTVEIYQQAKSGDNIGFSMGWQTETGNVHVSYGIERYNSNLKKWVVVEDFGTNFLRSTLITIPDPKNSSTPLEMVRLNYSAPATGTYLIKAGHGTGPTFLAGSEFNFDTFDSLQPQSFTFYRNNQRKLSQQGDGFYYFYIPKGLSHLELEKVSNAKTDLEFFTADILTGSIFNSRTVNLGKIGHHSIELKNGEAGSIARLNLVDFHLYNVPGAWARTPASLMVPRAVAIADGLTID